MDSSQPDKDQLHYLELLSEQYPSRMAVTSEIIRLTAMLNLPKGTEHFLADVHGEYEAFLHVLKNASGAIRRKIDEMFAHELSPRDRAVLATIIFYPEEKLPRVISSVENRDEWYRNVLSRLIRLCRREASKYTRSAVREALPPDFAFILEELLHEQEGDSDKHDYYESIIETIISMGRAGDYIAALSKLLQRISVDRLHIIGDVYDRGPGAHIIMDTLVDYHCVDFQWGNHDIVWMGAATGGEACMANVVRVGLRYGNLAALEEGYAISLLPLASFAMDHYAADPPPLWKPMNADSDTFTEKEIGLLARMHKAISIIQFKLEGQIIRRRPDFAMEDRLLLDKIDFDAGTIRLGGKTHPLLDTHLPTVDPARPYELSDEERMVVEKLTLSFAHSEKLQSHVRFLYTNGAMYLACNGNLLFHGCIPMNEDGTFQTCVVDGKPYAAKAYLDRSERRVRRAFFSDDPARRREGQDETWRLWCGAGSPLYGKDRMATFERYFLADESLHEERRNPYFELREREDVARMILEEFGLCPDTGHIVNGHVPVKVKAGERPVKAGGRLIAIDGGFSRAYQHHTGIAGYTLVFNSYGLLLASHSPFASTRQAIEAELDIATHTEILETNDKRIRVKDTDIGKKTLRKMDDLHRLLDAYRTGALKVRSA